MTKSETMITLCFNKLIRNYEFNMIYSINKVFN